MLMRWLRRFVLTMAAFGVVCIIVIVAVILSAKEEAILDKDFQDPNSETEEKTSLSTKKETEADKEKACRNDIQCWGEKNHLEATLACQPLIENMAKFDFEWTGGWLGSKLSEFRWKSLKSGELAYWGDQVKFQNGFGAWQRMTYWCNYDPGTKKADVLVFERQ